MSSSESDHEGSEKPDQDSEPCTFTSLGLIDELCSACARLGWKQPSRIQREAIPLALEGRDVIGLAETGSGKTAAFALPILQVSSDEFSREGSFLKRGKVSPLNFCLQALMEAPQRLFALVLTPTRELAYQISEQFDKLGKTIDLRTAVLVGKRM